MTEEEVEQSPEQPKKSSWSSTIWTFLILAIIFAGVGRGVGPLGFLYEDTEEPFETDPATTSFSFDPYSDGSHSFTVGAVSNGQPSAAGERLQRDFRWSYGGHDWTWPLDMDRGAYDYYRERDRQGFSHEYAAFVLDPYDDVLIDNLAQRFLDAGDEAGFSKDQVLRMALVFVQSIPYAADDVTTPYDEYPRYPIETLVDSGSDCEDTSILFASLAQALGYGVVLLLLPGHLAVGIKGSGIDGSYVERGGTRYYYAETTGEGYGIGDIPEQYENAQVRVLSLEDRAQLASLHWTTEQSGGSITVRVEVENVGSRAAAGTVMYAAFDAGNGRVWVQEQCDPLTLEPSQSAWCELTMRIPNRGTETRLLVSAWADNAAVVHAHSDTFTT